MEIKSISKEQLSKMFLAGAMNLEAKKEWINELNVFPVPDGDTGTNMSMTIMSAAREVVALENPTMAELCKAMSSGSLRGARGNSGVILSQLFRGFCKVAKTHEELDVPTIAEACEKAVETAYKAVMKPKEGTILTVAKGMSDKATELAAESDDIAAYMKAIIDEGDYVLSQTPEMLPVLKQAGVVDSGGQGLMEVMRGAYDALLGKEVDLSALNGEAKPQEAEAEETGYCAEFIITPNEHVSTKVASDLKHYLESIGDEVIVIADDRMIKVHVHSENPGLAVQKGIELGLISKVKIENLKDGHHETIITKEDKEKLASESTAAAPVEEKAEAPAPEVPMEHKDMGFISVSIGEGINEIFTGLGVDYIIEGGQTMNPSTEDMLNAIEHVNADHIFILPNNKNIVMAANQAASLVEDKDIIVIPTKTIPQGICALINFIADYSVEENKETMLAEIAKVKTGQVTYAVRDTEIDGKTIKENDFMGIGDKSILSVGQDLKDTTIEMVDQMMDDESALVSIYYGSDATEEAAEELASIIQGKYPDVEIEVNNGGQPIYYYVISVE